MTTLDLGVMLLLAGAILALGWSQYVKARRYGTQQMRGPVPATEDEPSGPQGPVLDRRTTP